MLYERVRQCSQTMLLSHPSSLELAIFAALVAATASFFTSLLLIVTKKWHGTFSMDSSTGIQKFHTTPTPRIAGISLVMGFLFAYAFTAQTQRLEEEEKILSSILLAGMPAFLFGLLEDITKKISVKTRLIATITSGLLGWWITGISLSKIDVWGIDWMLSFSALSVIFTAFAIGGVANAINIIDGFNGLTSGVAIIIFSTFGLIAFSVGDISLSIICLIIAGAVLGFFLINWPYGKIFLGDGGAYFLGFTLAWIAVLLPERNQSVSPWASLLVCSYPILEVSFSFIRKSLRKGYHPSQPDGVHLHMLTNRRWVRRFFPKSTKTIQNSMTSPFLWLYSSIPCFLALLTYESTKLSISSFTLSIILYILFYRKLAFFHWSLK